MGRPPKLVIPTPRAEPLPSPGVKQLRRWASVAKSANAKLNLPVFAFAAQMFAGHLVCGFIGIYGRDNVRVLLLPAATVAKLDLVHVHGDKSCTRTSRCSRRPHRPLLYPAPRPYGSAFTALWRARGWAANVSSAHLFALGTE